MSENVAAALPVWSWKVLNSVRGWRGVRGWVERGGGGGRDPEEAGVAQGQGRAP